jgi:hypothetical protein
MKAEAKRRIKKSVVNTFGTLGYLFGFLQWLWAIVLYLSVIQSTTSFINNKDTTQIVEPATFSISMPGPLGVIILGVTIVVMVAITIYAIVAVPRSIVKVSNKVVHKAAESVAPMVIKAQHKKDTKRTRIQLTARLILVVKAALVITPLLITAASRLLEVQFIDYSIALIVGCGLASLSFILFALQYILGAVLRVKVTDIR